MADTVSVLRGCRCEPTTTVRHRDGFTHVEIRHDDDCPAVVDGPRRDYGVIYPPTG